MENHENQATKKLQSEKITRENTQVHDTQSEGGKMYPSRTIAIINTEAGTVLQG